MIEINIKYSFSNINEAIKMLEDLREKAEKDEKWTKGLDGLLRLAKKPVNSPVETPRLVTMSQPTGEAEPLKEKPEKAKTKRFVKKCAPKLGKYEFHGRVFDLYYKAGLKTAREICDTITKQGYRVNLTTVARKVKEYERNDKIQSEAWRQPKDHTRTM